MAEATAKATTSTSTAKQSTTKKTTPKTTPLLGREPRTLAQEATYAYAALVDEAVDFAQGLPTRITELREQAPDRVTELREQVGTSIRDLREKATKQLEARVSSFETSFDSRVEEGRKVTDKVRSDERVAKVEQQVGRVWDQTDSTRSQVKAAVTSVRRTADVAVEAGRKQAETAQSQVKAAVTSARKTVDTVVDAGRNVAS